MQLNLDFILKTQVICFWPDNFKLSLTKSHITKLILKLQLQKLQLVRKLTLFNSAAYSVPVLMYGF